MYTLHKIRIEIGLASRGALLQSYMHPGYSPWPEAIPDKLADRRRPGRCRPILRPAVGLGTLYHTVRTVR